MFQINFRYSHLIIFCIVCLIFSVTVFGSIPPHPRVDSLIQEGKISLPYHLDKKTEALARGINGTTPSVQGFSPYEVPRGKTSTTFKAIAILVRFTDNPSQVAPSYFDNLLYGTSGNTMRTYFTEVSYGQLDVVTVNLPSSIGWLNMPQTYSYYVAGNNGFGFYPQNAQKLTEDAVAAANATVDFSQYDNNSDGYVDALFIIHAGPGAEYTGNVNDIWSHKWQTSEPQLVDGVYAYVYSMEPEYWAAPGDMTCGVYAHEAGHSIFGLPDLYDYGGDSRGLGRWSLMAGGSWNGTLGSSPAHPDAWSRIEMGFVTPTVVSTNVTDVNIPAVKDNPTIYKLWTNGLAGTEYFLVENRQKIGFDTYLRGDGLCIYHVDETQYGNNNQWYPGYTDYGHYQVALEQADGLWDLEKNINTGDTGDTYPGSTNNTIFSNSSTPNSKDYNFNSTSVGVTNISSSSLIMTANFSVQPIPPDISVNPTSVELTLGSGDTTTRILNIINTGLGELEFSISIIPTTLNSSTDKFLSYIENPTYIDPTIRAERDAKRLEINTERPLIINLSGGQYLVWDSDLHSSTGEVIRDILIGLSYTVDYTTTISSITDFSSYRGVFIALGVYPNNHVLLESEVNGLKNYLDNGGKIYMEGADTWAYDSRTTLHNYFNISGINDGTNDLYNVSGITGTFTEGLSYTYSGANNWIDRISPITPAFSILVNPSPSYFCGVAYDAGNYKTIGTSLSLGGLNEGTNTKQELIQKILEFFGSGPVHWLSTIPTSGFVQPGSSTDVALFFDATYMDSGSYIANVKIINNDPDENPVLIPVNLTVIGQPNIVVSKSSINFGNLLIGTVKTDSIIISNSGSDILNVSNIASDNSDYSVSATNFSLDPGEHQNVVVTFTPSVVGERLGKLTITSNDPDEGTLEVDLSGVGIEPPNIVVTPTSLDTNLYTGEQATKILTIENTGASDLVFDIGIETVNGLLSHVNIFENNNSITTQNSDKTIIHNKDLPEWEANGVDEETYKELLNRALLAKENRSEKTQLFMEGRETNKTINTAGAIIDDFENISGWPWVPWVSVEGGGSVNTGCAHHGSQGITDPGWYYRTDVTVGIPNDKISIWIKPGSGRFYMGFGASANGAWSLVAAPNSGELIIQENAFYGFSILASGPQSWIQGQWYKLEVVFEENGIVTGKLYSSDGTTQINQISTAIIGFQPGGVAIRSFDSFCGDTFEKGGASGWLVANPTSGSIPPGNRVNIAVTFDATSLNGGDYNANILIKNNDPDPDQDTVIVPAHLHVTGAPDITLSDAVIDYDTSFIGIAKPGTLRVSNVGTDILNVSNITSDNSDYSVSATNFSVNAGGYQDVVVTFTPSVVGERLGKLTITSNDPDEGTLEVDLSGVGIQPPNIVVSPTSLSSDLFTGEMETKTLTISNTAEAGSSDLHFNVALQMDEALSTNKVFVSKKDVTGSLDTRIGEILSGAEYHPNQVIVKFKRGVQTTQAMTVRSEIDAIVEKKFKLIGAELWNVSGVSVTDVLSRYRGNPLIEYIEPNYVVRAIDKIPNDPYFSSLWGMQKIQAPAAWDKTTGSDVLIGVIDTGVDPDHVDLAANIWTNPGEISGNGIDDDGNGYIDDIHGWDFYNNDNNPYDDNGHGTHVSGTIAAIGNNGIGVVGVCWSAKIMGLKFLSSGGSGSTSGAISALEYATMMNVRLTSNSWGGGEYSQALYDAIQAAGAAGDLFIAAAGNSSLNNDTYPHYPSSYTLDNIISVASTTSADLMSGFSNYGLVSVDLGAPGSDIMSTFPGNTYGTISGTSMATPHVSGVAGLILSQNSTLGWADVKGIIMSTVDPISALTGKCVTGGRLNANSAVNAVQTWLSVNPMSGAVAAGNSVELQVTFDATGLNGGDYNGNILVLSNDPTPEEDTISVSALLHVTGAPDIALSDTSFNYHNVFISAAKRETLRVSNVGTDVLNVSNITSDNSDYSVSATNFSVNAGEYQDVVVTFTPSVVGERLGTLTITSNDNDEGTLEVDLLGVGVEPPNIVVSPTSLDTSLYTGEQATKILTIENTGASDLLFDVSIENVPTRAVSLKIESVERQGKLFSVLFDPNKYRSDQTSTADRAIKSDPNRRIEVLPHTITKLQNSSGLNVLLAMADDGASYLSSQLLAYPDIASVTTFNTRYGTPTLTELQAYDAVMVWTNYTPYNATALGDILADYVDAGGGVIISAFAWYSNCGSYSMCGRIMNPSYTPLISTSSGNHFSTASMQILNASHPIMEDVVSATDYFRDYTLLTDGSELLARWSDGENFVAVKNRIAAINSYVGDNKNFSGDVPLIVHNSLLYVAGRSTNWFSANPNSGVVPPGTSINIDVTFDATGMIGGDYNANILIKNNDPDPGQDTVIVPVHLHVTGAPDIALSDTSFNYHNVFISAAKRETLRVSNVGTDVLNVSNITSDNSDYSVSATNFSVNAGEYQDVVVTFTPSVVGERLGTLTITSNDNDEGTLEVDLLGVGVEPPNIVVSPTSLDTSLYTGEQATKILTIENTGASDLTFDIKIVPISGGEGKIVELSNNVVGIELLKLAKGTLDGVTITGQELQDGKVIKTFNELELTNFKEKLSIYRKQVNELLNENNNSQPKIAVVGSGTYDMIYALLDDSSLVQKYLFFEVYYFDNYSQIEGYDGLIVCENDYNITNSEAISLNTFFNSGKPIIMGMDDLDDNFYYNPGTKALITPVFGITDAFDGNYYWGSLNRNNSITEGIVQIYQYNFWLGSDNDWYSLNGGDWIFAGTETNYYGISYEGQSRTVLMGENLAGIWWDGNGQLIENAIDWMMQGVKWLSVSPESGVVPASSSMDIMATFDATGLNGGEYRANINVYSNDPDEDTVVVPAYLHVTGAPDITLSDTALNYGTVFIGVFKRDTIIVSNDGTDVLTVSNITSDNSDYSVSATNFSVNAGEYQDVVVTFTPSVVGERLGTLTITSDDPDEGTLEVDLVGVGVEPPNIVVTPTSLDTSLYTGEQATKILTIKNTGAVNLTFNLEISQVQALNTQSDIIKVKKMSGDIRTDVAPEGYVPTYANSKNIKISTLSNSNVLLLKDYQPWGTTSNEAILNSLGVPYQIQNSSSLPGLNLSQFTLIIIASDQPTSFYQNIANNAVQINNYVASGGILEFHAAGWGWNSGNPSLVTLPGDVRIAQRFANTNYIVDNSHPVIAGVPNPFTGTSASHSYFYNLVMNTNVIVNDGSDPNLIEYKYHAGTVIASGQTLEISYAWGWQGGIILPNLITYSLSLEKSWLSADPTSGVVPPGTSMNIEVTFDATELNDGDYNANIVVVSNDPDENQILVPAHLQIFSGPREISFEVNKRWNIISVPLKCQNARLDYLFPTANSNAFKYRETYSTSDTLETGVGYWLKFPETQTITLNGTPMKLDTIDVDKGWNMIGTISEVIPVSTITPIGTSIRSCVYGYSGGYYITETLKPGSGYWIYTNSSGKIVLSKTGTTTNFTKTVSSKNTMNFLNLIEFEDADGNFQTLYFGMEDEQLISKEFFKSPPPPPEGAFDVRFVSQQFVEIFSSQNTLEEYPIMISSSAYPVTIKWKIKGENQPRYILLVQQDEKVDRLILSPSGGPIKLKDDKSAKLILKIETIPNNFALEQNYPNPFNPTTTIKYALPEEAKVTINIFNILGQNVETLIDDIQSAGYKNIEWNAKSISSGIYYYRLEAASVNNPSQRFIQVRKMILLR